MQPKMLCVVCGVLAVLSPAASTFSTLDHREPQLGGLQHGEHGELNRNSTDVDIGSLSSRAVRRRKRYIVYPRGSSIQLVYCMTVRGYIPFQSLFTFGLTAGLAWQLPTEPQQLYLQRRDTGRDPDRAHRFNLYRSLQAFLTQRGFHGEECVQRTLCESSDPHLQKGTFMEELLKVLFSLPNNGNENRTTWDAARYNGTSCEVRFPRCTSVLDISLPRLSQINEE